MFKTEQNRVRHESRIAQFVPAYDLTGRGYADNALLARQSIGGRSISDRPQVSNLEQPPDAFASSVFSMMRNTLRGQQSNRVLSSSPI